MFDKKMQSKKTIQCFDIYDKTNNNINKIIISGKRNNAKQEISF